MTWSRAILHTYWRPSCIPFGRGLQVHREAGLEALHTFLSKFRGGGARARMRAYMCIYVKYLFRSAGSAVGFKLGLFRSAGCLQDGLQEVCSG
jgi:hypothetical protein